MEGVFAYVRKLCFMYMILSIPCRRAAMAGEKRSEIHQGERQPADKKIDLVPEDGVRYSSKYIRPENMDRN